MVFILKLAKRRNKHIHNHRSFTMSIPLSPNNTISWWRQYSWALVPRLKMETVHKFNTVKPLISAYGTAKASAFYTCYRINSLNNKCK